MKKKKKHRQGKSGDIDGLGAATTIGKGGDAPTDSEGIVAPDFDQQKPRRIGTPLPKIQMKRRKPQRQPKSSAATPDWWGGKMTKSKGPGSRGGHVIGKTRSGKPIYAHAAAASYSNFTSEDHTDAARHHGMRYGAPVGSKHDPGSTALAVRHGKLNQEHRKHAEAAARKETKAAKKDVPKEVKHHFKQAAHHEREQARAKHAKKWDAYNHHAQMFLHHSGEARRLQKLQTKKSEDTMGQKEVKKSLGGFEQFFKSTAPVEEVEMEDDDEDEEVAKGDEADGVDATGESVDDEGDEVADDDDVEKGDAESFACPHCASDITPDMVVEGLTKSKGGKEKMNKDVPARTAAAQEKEGFTSGKKNVNGKPKSGTKTPTRGVHGVAKVPNSGNAGSYAKSFHGESPLMALVKSDNDIHVAREIARSQGLDPDKIEGLQLPKTTDEE